MAEGIATAYKNICFLCGKPATCEHHLIFGLGLRGTESIHNNIAAERLSKIAGQLLFKAKIGTREEFRKRYGQSYL